MTAPDSAFVGVREPVIVLLLPIPERNGLVNGLVLLCRDDFVTTTETAKEVFWTRVPVCETLDFIVDVSIVAMVREWCEVVDSVVTCVNTVLEDRLGWFVDDGGPEFVIVLADSVQGFHPPCLTIQPGMSMIAERLEEVALVSVVVTEPPLQDFSIFV